MLTRKPSLDFSPRVLPPRRPDYLTLALGLGIAASIVLAAYLSRGVMLP